MSRPASTAEWQLADLLDAASLDRLGPAWPTSWAAPPAIVDGQGKGAVGRGSSQARQEPLVVELEPIGCRQRRCRAHHRPVPPAC